MYQWKKQFERFELYADQLTQEANDLKAKIEREKREAKRLSSSAPRPLLLSRPSYFTLTCSCDGEIQGECRA
jgi:hypothetical protein